ncbi:transcription factor DIVARICATA-like [Nymphaea colorata]|nr:transcription factor DIVARICATA-like [Nymphaea colorata]
MGWGYPSSSAACLPEWTHHQNKLFEDALAVYGPETPDRWERIASRVPGKTAADVKRHYESLVQDVNSIDSGAVPIPLYVREWADEVAEELTTEFQVFRQPSGAFGKAVVGRGFDQERKKGVPWTEEEHRLFLMGLKKYGKGDWRSISRNFVVTRTPTQVASHAQKYFIRLNSGTKDKRRPSIHDITSINEPESDHSNSPDSMCSNRTSVTVDHKVPVSSSNTKASNMPAITARPSTLYDHCYGVSGNHPSGSFNNGSSFGSYILHPTIL